MLVLNSKVVDENKRLEFFPKHCGKNSLIFERTIYYFARYLCPSYDGSYWEFYECDNGAFFMVPTIKENYDVFVQGNGFEDVLEAEAFGITVTLFSLSYLAERDDLFISKYYLLLDFLEFNPHYSLIQRAID